MTWEQVWNVLRWVLAALVAGFIGQFGKSLALRLIQRKRAKASQSDIPRDPEIERTKAQAKIEKKRAKTEVKRLKKS